ncbi:MAG: hypothetical protein M3P27_00095 [Acidobacteriota bacterium]|nr:hypothetical protein [Acidobacteriota bacterium]
MGSETAIFGIPLHLYTVVHVVISLVGIAAGLVVMFGMVSRPSKRMDGFTAIFLGFTVATSVTGFGFVPLPPGSPAVKVGVISLVVLAVALVARYAMRLAGKWRAAYVVTAAIALYLNCFVLVVQMFQKILALRALAGAGQVGNEPPGFNVIFGVTQGVVLVGFVALTVVAVKRFR